MQKSPQLSPPLGLSAVHIIILVHFKKARLSSGKKKKKANSALDLVIFQVTATMQNVFSCEERIFFY